MSSSFFLSLVYGRFASQVMLFNEAVLIETHGATTTAIVSWMLQLPTAKVSMLEFSEIFGDLFLDSISRTSP